MGGTKSLMIGTIGRSIPYGKRNKRRTKPYIGVCRGIENVVLLHAVSVSVGQGVPCSDMSWEVSGEVPYKASPVSLFSQCQCLGIGYSEIIFQLVSLLCMKARRREALFLPRESGMWDIFIQGLTCRDALPIKEGVGSRQIIQQWNFHGVDWPFTNLSWRVRSLLHR